MGSSLLCYASYEGWEPGYLFPRQVGRLRRSRNLYGGIAPLLHFTVQLNGSQANTSASSGFSRYSSLISLGPKGQVCSTKRAQRRYATMPRATQASENNMGVRPDE